MHRTKFLDAVHGCRSALNYFTDVGEINIESQKISIAKALYKNAPIVILDEPTAALDPREERSVRRAI